MFYCAVTIELNNVIIPKITEPLLALKPLTCRERAKKKSELVHEKNNFEILTPIFLNIPNNNILTATTTFRTKKSNNHLRHLQIAKRLALQF